MGDSLRDQLLKAGLKPSAKPAPPARAVQASTNTAKPAAADTRDRSAQRQARRLYGARADLVLCEQPYDALQDADVLALMTEWKVFRSPDFARIRTALRMPALFDGRNLYDPASVEAAGIAYYGIGRGRSLEAQR